MGKIHGRNDINKIMGMEVKDASEYLKSIGHTLRVKQDGTTSHMVSSGYDPKRINVHTNKGIVIDIFDIG